MERTRVNLSLTDVEADIVEAAATKAHLTAATYARARTLAAAEAELGPDRVAMIRSRADGGKA